MDLPRTFVGFSSADAAFYQEMCGWKSKENIGFEFCSCRLHLEARSGEEAHVKQLCRDRIKMAGAYIMLIGADTLSNHRYLHWEAQVAREKGCKMIGVNLNHRHQLDTARTPSILHNIGALFVPFSPLAVQAALRCDVRRDNQNYELTTEWYEANGYEIVGEMARVGSPFKAEA